MKYIDSQHRQTDLSRADVIPHGINSLTHTLTRLTSSKCAFNLTTSAAICTRRFDSCVNNDRNCSRLFSTYVSPHVQVPYSLRYNAHPCITHTRMPSFQFFCNRKIYNPMYNKHRKFHSWDDDPSASVQLAAVKDWNMGQQISRLFIQHCLSSTHSDYQPR